jgi:hypothetical protein
MAKLSQQKTSQKKCRPRSFDDDDVQTHGIGICSNCNRIGTKEFYCRNCVEQPGMMNRVIYTDYEEVLQNGEGVYFNCHAIWKANTICPHCCESMVTQLPTTYPGVFYLFQSINDKPLFASSMERSDKSEVKGTSANDSQDIPKGVGTETRNVGQETIYKKNLDPIIQDMLNIAIKMSNQKD